MSGKVPAVFSPNYSVGVNILFKLAEALKAFPEGYDFSTKRNPPHRQERCTHLAQPRSLSKYYLQVRSYTKTVYGREGISPRQPAELESVAIACWRSCQEFTMLIVAGPNEMLRIEHTAFSRNVFAQGAVYAAEWLSKQNEPKVFNMADVLGLS